VFHWRLTSFACLACLAAIAATSARAAQPTLTVKQYRHDANAICSDFNAFRMPTQGAFDARLATLVAKAQESLAALRELQPPRSLAKLHADLMAVNGKRIDFLAAMVARLKSGKLTIARLAARLAASPYPAMSDALWKRVGAFDCVQY
jgi:hypothetical protein